MIKRSDKDIYLGWYLTLRYNAEKICGRHKVAKLVFWFQLQDDRFIFPNDNLTSLPSLYLGRRSKSCKGKPHELNIPDCFFDKKNFVRLIKEPLLPVRQSIKTGINHSNLTNFIGVDLYTAIKSNYYSLDVLSSLINHLYHFLVDLHNNNIVIMDLKPENILVEERGGTHRLVIIDEESWRSLDNLSNPEVTLEALTLNKEEQSNWSKSKDNLYQYSQKKDLTDLGKKVVSLFFKLLDLRCYISILEFILNIKSETDESLPNIDDNDSSDPKVLYEFSNRLKETKSFYSEKIQKYQDKLFRKSCNQPLIFEKDVKQFPYALEKKDVPSVPEPADNKRANSFEEEPRRSRWWCCC